MGTVKYYETLPTHSDATHIGAMAGAAEGTQSRTGQFLQISAAQYFTCIFTARTDNRSSFSLCR